MFGYTAKSACFMDYLIDLTQQKAVYSSLYQVNFVKCSPNDKIFERNLVFKKNFYKMIEKI